MRRGRLPTEKAVVGGKGVQPHNRFPLTNALSFDKHPFIQQPPSPYNNPPLFVIPSEARDLRFSFRLAKSPLATTPLCHPEPQPTSIC